MILLRTNRLNSLISTASQTAELTNPVFLFSFTNIFTKEQKSFIPRLIESNLRYDEFEFRIGPNENLTASTPTVNFTENGQYYYSVYEQTSTTNLSPTFALNKLEEGRADLINPDQTSPYDIYQSPNENNSNFVYYTDIENSSDVNIVFRIQAIINQDIQWYSDGRAPLPYFQTDSSGSYVKERLMTSYVDARNGTNPSPSYRMYEDIVVNITGGGQSIVFYSDSTAFSGTSWTMTNGGNAKLEYTNFVVYSSATQMQTVEPALNYTNLPTGNTCGRYVVLTTTVYDPSNTIIFTGRSFTQEFGGYECNVSTGSTSSWVNIPTLWSNNSLEIPYGLSTLFLALSNTYSVNGLNVNWGVQPTPTPTPTPSSTITPTPTLTSTPTPTPTLAVFDVDYQAILTNATSAGLVQPSYTEKIKQNQLVLDLKSANLWTKLGNFYLFKLDEDGVANSRSFTLINWKKPTLAKANLISWDGSEYQFINDEGWFLRPKTGINLRHNVIPNMSNLTTTNNSEGGYYKDVITSTTGRLWQTDNNSWNAVSPGDTTSQIVFRDRPLTVSYDFSGDGFKGVHATGTLVSNIFLTFRNQGVNTLRQKTAADGGAGGGTIHMGSSFISSLGFEGTVQSWYSGINILIPDMEALDTILTNYMNS